MSADDHDSSSITCCTERMRKQREYLMSCLRLQHTSKLPLDDCCEPRRPHGVRMSGDGPTARSHLGRVGLGCPGLPGGLGAGWAGARQASSRPPHPGTHCVSQNLQCSHLPNTLDFPPQPPSLKSKRDSFKSHDYHRRSFMIRSST